MNHKNIRKIILSLGIAGLTAVTAQAQFSPRNLAVLRAGDNGTSAASDLLNAHQAPTFIDEFDPVTPIIIPSTDTGTQGPIFSVAIPTNDPAIVPPYAAMWFNGHAGSEGYLALSGDAGTLSFSGYGGDILAVPGTPSNLGIPRGICVIDVEGNSYIPLESSTWYGLGAGVQTNPRGVVSDNGTNNFFGSGSLDGNEWFQLGNASTPESVQNLSSVRAVKIINGFFYTSLQGNDGGTQYPAGIYDYQPVTLVNDSIVFGPPVALPEGNFFVLNLVVPASPSYPNVESFDINPQKNIAYIADSTFGIQKYVEVAGNWTLACAFGITNNTSASVTSFPASYTGCFGLVVDWSGSYPVVFATTTEGTGNYTHQNRVIRIDDNYNFTDGQLHTNDVFPTTLATAWANNVGFRGLAWTPDRRAVITTNPASQSVVIGASVTFTVTATTNFANTYSWYANGALDSSQTSTNYTVAPALAGGSYYVVVGNQFGSVTSTVANLTVDLAAVAPSVTSPAPALNLTNAVYDTITIPVVASGTTPLSYLWYQGTTLLSDGGDFSGTATGTLTINVSSATDAGSYYVVVNNGTGTPSSNLVAAVSIVTPLPIIFSEPVNTTVASNGVATLTALAYPLNVTYQWYQGATPLQNVSGHWGGTTGPVLTNLNAQTADAGSYSVVVTGAGGSVTSTVVALTVETPAPYSVVPYTSLGMVYRQNFNSLPDPGVTSVNASTGVLTTIAGTNYFVGNPFDFAAPAIQGGGLNLPGMIGWYSSDLGAEEIQATTGDNTTGLIVSFGCTNAINAINPLYSTNNRALGIISSPQTSAGGAQGNGAAGNADDGVFALRLQNVSGQTLTNLNLSYVSELWRNTLVSNIVTNYYYVDTFGTNSTPTNNVTGFLTTLLFPTNLGSAPSKFQKTYGTNAPIATNQISFVNLPLATPWPQGGVLWIVWEEPIGVSGGQGIGIDDLVFSSGPLTLGIQQTGSSVALSWPVMFTGYTLQSNPDVTNPGGWSTAGGGTLTVSEGINTYTVPISPGNQYFRLYHP